MSRNQKNVRAGFLIHTLELNFEVFPCLYVEAMYLQCFPLTLRERALFRKLVLLACRVWPWLFCGFFCVKEKCINLMIVHLEMFLGHEFLWACRMKHEPMIRFLIHTLEWLFEVFPQVCMWKPCICNVSLPLYVSVRYLENASFWTICLQSMALAVLHGFWTFFSCLVCPLLEKKEFARELC